MAWGYRAGTGHSTNTLTSPLVDALAAAVSVGDRVIVAITPAITGSTESVTSVTDTNGFCGTFSKDVESAAIVDGTVQAKTSIWSAPVTGAGTPSLSIVFVGSNCGASAGAWSGLDQSVGSGAVDITGAATGGQSTTPTVTLGATNFANELGIGGFGDDGWAVTFTSGGTATNRASQAAVNCDSAIQEQDTGSSGSTPTMSGTLSGAGSIWGMVGVVYKLAPAGTTPTLWAQGMV